jgi:NAD(P)-dependent dehydrogenase (short-subunit alcohol dehydrogenase family)
LDRSLEGKVALVIGGGDDAQRSVAVALAQAGASVAVVGVVSDLAAEARLHSIANEVWALGRRSMVVTLSGEDDSALSGAGARVKAELGSVNLIVRASAAG